MKEIKSDKQERDYNKGHRDRIRDRFLNNPDSLEDYEFLELILFSTHPRKDTKISAKEMIKHFGSLKNVLNATTNELMESKLTNKAGIASIKLIRESLSRLLKRELQDTSIKLDNTVKVANYCIMRIGALKTEEILVLFLDSKCQLAGEEELKVGDTDSIFLNKANLVAKASQNKSKRIIISHNHPSGDCTPSPQDIATTRDLMESLAGVNIDVLDHIVVSKDNYYSMKINQCMDKKIKKR